MIPISIWIGLGTGWIVQRSSTKILYLKPLIKLGFFALIIIQAILKLPSLDLSAFRTVERYAQDVFRAVPPSAILITTGDESTFALWYYHFAYHQCSDIAIVSSDLLSQTWYRTILNYTYPGLTVRDGFKEQDILRENVNRPGCRLESNLRR